MPTIKVPFRFPADLKKLIKTAVGNTQKKGYSLGKSMSETAMHREAVNMFAKDPALLELISDIDDFKNRPRDGGSDSVTAYLMPGQPDLLADVSARRRGKERHSMASIFEEIIAIYLACNSERFQLNNADVQKATAYSPEEARVVVEAARARTKTQHGGGGVSKEGPVPPEVEDLGQNAPFPEDKEPPSSSRL